MPHPRENAVLIRYLGANKVTRVVTTSDPGAGDDGYQIGTLWINTTDDGTFICTDNTAEAAVWKEVTFV
jgi:hypothetical protein